MGDILIKIYLGPYSLNVACCGPHESQLYKQCCEWLLHTHNWLCSQKERSPEFWSFKSCDWVQILGLKTWSYKSNYRNVCESNIQIQFYPSLSFFPPNPGSSQRSCIALDDYISLVCFHVRYFNTGNSLAWQWLFWRHKTSCLMDFSHSGFVWLFPHEINISVRLYLPDVGSFVHYFRRHLLSSCSATGNAGFGDLEWMVTTRSLCCKEIFSLWLIITWCYYKYLIHD